MKIGTRRHAGRRGRGLGRWTALRAVALAAVVYGAGAMPLLAQSASALRLVATGDTVLVYLTAAPPAPGDWVVSRRLVVAGAETWVRRTTAPVEPVRDPSIAAGRLGPDLATAMRAVRAADAPEMLRRLAGDPFAAGVLSLLSRSAALVLGRLFVDTAASRGAEYEYRVAFTTAAGEETGRVVTGRVRVADVTPAAPPAPAARGADHAIVLSWHYPTFTGSPTDFVVGFHVYRADGAGPGAGRRLTATPVLRNDAPGAVLEFRDVEPANGVPYRYTLTAVDVAGRESAPSPAVTAHAKDVTPPGMPTGLAVRNGDGVVTLTWRLSPEADVAGYHVERSTGLSRPYTRLDRALLPASQPLWTDTVAGGRQYFYRVVAVDSAGNASAPSNPVSAQPEDRTPPAPPTAVTATAAQRRLTIRWNASPSRDVRGYYVYRGESGRFVRLVTRPVETLAFTDSGYGGNGGALATLTPGMRLSDSGLGRGLGVQRVGQGGDPGPGAGRPAAGAAVRPARRERSRPVRERVVGRERRSRRGELRAGAERRRPAGAGRGNLPGRDAGVARHRRRARDPLRLSADGGG